MKHSPSRRRFLQDVGKTVITTTIGPALAADLGMMPTLLADEEKKSLHFGELEGLASFLQDTSSSELQPALVAKIRKGVSLEKLISGAALANARSFGGEDYIGFHTLMAMKPALKMAAMMSGSEAPLPVFKVLYRNTHRIQEHGGRATETLHSVQKPKVIESTSKLREFVQQRNVAGAERLLKGLIHQNRETAFQALLEIVQDNPEVHRTVLPYRAMQMVDLIGEEHATTLLRQSLRYCLNAERYRQPGWDRSSELLANLLDSHNLIEKQPGLSIPDDAYIRQLYQDIFKASPEDAAGAVAAALAEGIAPTAIGEALSLAANQLVLRDPGRPPKWESNGKPPGSVHGDSIGVHASDSINAWRNLSSMSRGRNVHACLILGAWQVANDRHFRPELLSQDPLPVSHHLKSYRHVKDQSQLLGILNETIQGNLQGHATGVVAHYAKLGFSEEPIFQCLLRYAVSEDGALHAEKYFETVRSDFYNTRPAFRWNHLIGLARVTASEYGRPAAGQSEARQLLNIS